MGFFSSSSSSEIMHVPCLDVPSFQSFYKRLSFLFPRGKKKKTLMDKPFRNPGPSVAGEITFYKRSRGQRWAGQN